MTVTIDVLVNNAGICLVTPFLNIEAKEWHETLNTNLTGPFYVAQCVCRHMTKRASWCSTYRARKHGLDGEFGHASYNASKSSLILFTRTIVIELNHLGIRANTVRPGYVRSAINLQVDSDECVEAFASRCFPANRTGQ